jgi:DNA-binding NarL/FixJ family response regulator
MSEIWGSCGTRLALVREHFFGVVRDMNNLTRLVAAVDGAVQAGDDPDVRAQAWAGSRAEAVLGVVARDLGLSRRELDVLAATCRGRTTKEIAFALQLSTKTVEHYWERMFKKLHCGSKVEAMALLFRRSCSIVPGR